MSNAVVCTLALVTPLGAMWLVWVSVPDLMHTKFRHGLWEIRDEIVDDLISGNLTQNDATRRLLRSIYDGIEHAPRHTLRSGVVVYALMRDQAALLPSLSDLVLGSDAPFTERERLAEYLNRFYGLSLQHIRRGTPLAWVVGPVAQAVALLGHLRSHRVEDAVHRRVENVVKAEIAVPLFSDESTSVIHSVPQAC